MHALDGMGMVLDEAPEIPVPRPPGFPVCSSFYDDRSRDIDYQVIQNKDEGQDFNQSWYLFIYILKYEIFSNVLI